MSVLDDKARMLVALIDAADLRAQLADVTAERDALAAKLAAVPEYVAYYVTAWGPFEAAGGEGAEPLEFDAWLQARR